MRAMFPILKMLLAIAAVCAAQSARAALPIEHWTASTGARVMFVSSASIPMLDINLDLDAGARHEPSALAGLATLTASLADKGVAALGSAGARDEAAIADAFADVGAVFDSAASSDTTSFRLRTLSGRSERQPAVDLLAQIVSAPVFPEAVLARDKSRQIAALREALTQPRVLANRAFNAAIYGAHPYGQSASPETVARITRDDILRFYRAHYVARRAVVTMVGAISREEARAIAEHITRNLPTDSAMPPALPDVAQPLEQARTVRLPHPAQQASIVIGQPAIARGDPDYFPLMVGNYVLGGDSFNSRLTHEVREKRGLTYGIGSYFGPTAQPGPFQLALQTRKDQTEQALAIVRETLARFVAEGPTVAELRAAQDNLIKGFPMRLDSNRKLLDNVATIGWYRLPMDYLDRWPQRIAAVTREQVRAAFLRVLQPQTMATIIVGDPAAD